MAAPVPQYVYKAQYVSNHDGDNVLLALDHGKFPKSKAVTEAELRIKGLYCPELNEPGGPEAALLVFFFLAHAEKIVVQTYKGSFERTIADVWFDDKLLSTAIIESGHGSPKPR